jgi:hypothetical protein
MLWDHPYGGDYSVAEWLLSATFWLLIFLLAAAVVARAIYKHRGHPAGSVTKDRRKNDDRA